MKIKEIMTQDPECGIPETNLAEIARLMVKKDCGAIPIIRSLNDRRPVGIVTDRDITCRSVAVGKNPLDLTAGDIMTKPVAALPLEASLEECCHLMEQRQVRRMLVIDEKGNCSGIVAQADIARGAPEHETAELVKDVSMVAGAG